MSSWFVVPKPLHHPKLRLICLPYAGGSTATYQAWQRQMPDGVELLLIQPPGRAERFHEPPYKTMDTLVDNLATQFLPLTHTPYVLMGHSLGSLIGYELMKRLRLTGATLPRYFIASGCRAPHLYSKEQTFDLPKAAFIHELKKMNGTPEAILQNNELMELYLPLLRADFQVAETYFTSIGEPLNCTLILFSGTEDRGIKQADLEGWRKHFNSGGNIQMFEGDHFFIEQNGREILSAVTSLLEKLVNTNPRNY